MLDITLPSPRPNTSPNANGFVIMILRSANLKTLGRSIASWRTAKKILLTFSSTKKGNI